MEGESASGHDRQDSASITSERWNGSNKIRTIRPFVAEGARNIGAHYPQAGTDGRSREKRGPPVGLVFFLILVASFHRWLSSVMNARRFIRLPRRRGRGASAAPRGRA